MNSSLFAAILEHFNKAQNALPSAFAFPPPEKPPGEETPFFTLPPSSYKTTPDDTSHAYDSVKYGYGLTKWAKDDLAKDCEENDEYKEHLAFAARMLGDCLKLRMHAKRNGWRTEFFLLGHAQRAAWSVLHPEANALPFVMLIPVRWIDAPSCLVLQSCKVDNAQT